MARQVFFSFYYTEDSWRVSQIRNSWTVGREHTANPIYDKAEWETLERKGQVAVQNWIDSQLKGASVTVVLIGANTHTRPWVRYEIEKSHADGKGILGIHMVGMKNQNQYAASRGKDPIAAAGLKDRWGWSASYRTYEWIADDGRSNISDWVEAAARDAGR